MIRPPFVPADSAVSFFEVRERAGYSYRRYLGYTYAKRRGKKRRVHHYKLVTVPAKSVLYWITEAPPPLPKPAAKPKPSKEFPKPKGWINAAEWQDFLDQWASNLGFSIAWDGDIYKKSPASDQISRDLFVWPSARYPRGITLKSYPTFGTKVFYMIRLWVLIEHTEDEEMFVWVRTARLPSPMDYDEAKAQSTKLADAVSRDIEDFPYLAFRGLVGFTLYTLGTKATKKRRKEGTE